MSPGNSNRALFALCGRQHLSFGSRLLSWARDASYPVYILHQTLIIVIAYKIIQLPWQPWSKYWVVLGATLLGCVLSYEVLRRFAVLRIAFGIKTHKEPRMPSLARVDGETPCVMPGRETG